MTDIDISPKYSEVKPEGFYVYLHRRKTDNSVFYIGKGKCARAWRGINHRSDHWVNIAKKNGVIVEIYISNISEVCAFTLEKVLISIYGVGNLCNISLGGDGVSGRCGSIHHAYNHDAYSFINIDGLEFTGTTYDFMMAYKLSQSCVSNLVSGKRK